MTQTQDHDDLILVPLHPPSESDILSLKKVYAEENRSTGFVDYGKRTENFVFSMNQGDYMRPALGDWRDLDLGGYF